jgi:tetratricopeptide (TPR) repeat protein
MSDYVRPNARDPRQDVGAGSEKPLQPGAAGACGPAYPFSDDRETLRSAVQERTPEPPKAAQTLRKRAGGGAAILSVLFLCFSLAVLILTLRGWAPRGTRFPEAFTGGMSLRALLSALRPGAGPPAGKPLSSYLSFSSKEALSREAFALMEKKKAGLAGTERNLEELEKERNAFSGDMERRRDLLEKHVSVLDVARPGEKTAFFETTLRRRTGLYNALYERKKEMLTAERVRLKEEIKDLSIYVAEVRKSKSVPASYELEDFFRETAEQKLAGRLFFLIGKGEYDKAADTLNALLSIDRKGSNRLQAGLLRELLRLLDEYRERAAVFKKGGGLDELKMAYLEEEYGKAGKLAKGLNPDGYLLPVVVEFQAALERNERLSREANDDLGTRESLKSLSQKAVALEEKGEREKALKIYESLLMFDLSADDRERVLGKVRALAVASAKQEAKRQENTKASAYMEKAKLADREGREMEAVEGYTKIVLECPESDYAAEALARMIDLLKTGGV